MIDFVTLDPQVDLNSAIARWEAVMGETLYPGDEHYQFLAQMVQLITAAKADVNFAGNQNLLRYSSGANLDALGGDLVPRLAAQSASVTMRFSISTALAFDVIVSAGTRVTPDGQTVFQILSAAVISAGSLSADVTAVAAAPGSAYNGFLPGQIQSLIDPVDYVTTVTNTTASAGGTDSESDDSYRERIREHWEALSTAGADGAYEYWAKTADAGIADAKAVKTADGVATLYVLMKDAAIPSQAVLDKVTALAGDKKHRPLTDCLVVSTARVKTYDITLTYFISADRATEVAAIQASVNQAVSDFILARKQKLGGNLNPDDLRGALYAAGAYRVDLTAPLFTLLQPEEVAVANTPTITCGGLL
jgi:phage-related baseplate assembly protein